MDEKKYEINWLGLFIKVIVFVVVILLVIWLISKLTLKNKGLSIEENLELFTSSSVEYFKKNLPNEGETNKVTLNQLIKWNYLEELKDEKGKLCDKESTSQIELKDNYYEINTKLTCNKKEKTSTIKLGNNTCENCDIKVENLEIKKKEEQTKQEEITTNTSSKGQTYSEEQTQAKTVLYEFAKTIDRYSTWYQGKVTGTNIENSTKKVSYSKFCKQEELVYYTISYTSSLGKYSYTLELINLSDEETSLLSSTYFENINDYISYLENRNNTLYYVSGKNNKVSKDDDPYTYKNHALTSNNFTFKVLDIYKKNNKYYVDITINVLNFNNITPYYINGKKAYYVPIKFTLNSDNKNCIVDKTENKENYQNYVITESWDKTIDIYRYKISTVEYKYSNQDYIEGYTKTGNTKEITN